MIAFQKLGIDEDFDGFYVEEEISSPTEVQKTVIPKMLKKRSLICVAQTGTGKTLSYALPICELIKCIEDEHGVNNTNASPYAVIVVPTKELAVQVNNVIRKISHHVKLRTRSLVGGAKGKDAAVKNNAFEILVATPSRLNKSIKNKEIKLDNLQFVVFDEADNLFELGFTKEVHNFMAEVDLESTQISFFTATLPVEAREFLAENFGEKNLEMLEMSTAHRIQQRVETFNIFVTPEEKNKMLQGFLEKTAKGRGIVFINQKNQVKEVAEFLEKNLPKLKYRVLHGDLPQKDRLSALKSFTDKKSQVLIASDVAARGIDIKDIAWVLNYGLPKTPIYYLHRCGRTGRAGRKGIVYNFVTKYDSKLISVINEAIKKQTMLDIGLIAKDMKEVRLKKKNTAKTKTKRVKITKRNRHKY